LLPTQVIDREKLQDLWEENHVEVSDPDDWDAPQSKTDASNTFPWHINNAYDEDEDDYDEWGGWDYDYYDDD
jgi:hypothetical protein